RAFHVTGVQTCALPILHPHHQGAIMKIGIIGSGMIGETAARLFVKAGHEAAITNSRGPESLKELVRELGPQARATSVEDAAAFEIGRAPCRERGEGRAS